MMRPIAFLAACAFTGLAGGAILAIVIVSGVNLVSPIKTIKITTGSTR